VVFLPVSGWFVLEEQFFLATGALAGWASALVLVVPTLQFLLGGALVNLGFRMQDHLRDNDGSPTELLHQVLWQNRLAAKVRGLFPRSAPKPSVALVVCMDARIDTSELVGDTRKRYYVVRTAGSVLGDKEQDMLELAVLNGVRLILLTRHSDCAAEHLAHQTDSEHLRHLSRAVHQRPLRVGDFLSRPAIVQRLKDGRLEVVEAQIDTQTAELQVTGRHGPGTTLSVAPM
jgi:carbonic anhydrase